MNERPLTGVVDRPVNDRKGRISVVRHVENSDIHRVPLGPRMMSITIASPLGPENATSIRRLSTTKRDSNISHAKASLPFVTSSKADQISFGADARAIRTDRLGIRLSSVWLARISRLSASL